MNSATSLTSPPLPAGIAQLLTRVRRRIRQQQWIAGILKVFALGVACLVLAVAVNALPWSLPRTVRIAVAMVAALIPAAGVWWWLVRPLSGTLGAEAIARWLDARHPETQERLSTAVNLAGTEGSLMAAVLDEACQDAASLDPVRELPASRLRPAIAAAGMAVAVAAAVALFLTETQRVVTGGSAAGAVEPGDLQTSDDAGDVRETDAPPVVTLEDPSMDEITIRPNVAFPLSYSVQEDGAVSEVRLRIRMEDDRERMQELDPPEAGTYPGQWQGGTTVDLNGLPDGARDVRVAVVALDDRDPARGGPQAGVSREITVRIRGDARSLLEQAWEEQARELQRMMQETERTLQEAGDRMRRVANRMQGQGEVPPETFHQIDEGMRMAAEAQAAMEELAGQMEDSPFAAQSDSLQQAAKEFAGPAAQQAAEIAQTDDRDERAELAGESAEKLARAVDALRDERQRLEESKREVMRAAQVVELAELQTALAETAEAAAAGGEEFTRNREAGEKWVREEEAVARRADELRDGIDDSTIRRTEAMRQAVARHRQELEEGGRAAAEAAKNAESEADLPPDIGESAEQARESAGHLMAAAEAVLESMGMTPPGSGQATSGGPPKPGRPGNPAKPGQGKGTAAQQQETPSGAVPDAIALSGLAPGEWAAAKGIVRGATGGGSERVPPEYRELVRQYFERLSRATISTPEPRQK